MEVMQNGKVFSRTIRDVTYSINTENDDVTIGDITFNAKTNFDEEKFLFVMEVLNSDTFAAFLEIGMRIKLNEEKVGKEVLLEKYKTSYDSLRKETYDLCSRYLNEQIMKHNRGNKIYLKEYFESEEFKTLLSKLIEDVKEKVKNREFEKIPMLVQKSIIHNELEKRDVPLGNYEISCDAFEKNNKITTNIKWCKGHCPKFANCPVLERMKSEDAFNFSLNMEYLSE